MNDKIDSIKILSEVLNFDKESIDQLNILHDELINYNSKYNLISKVFGLKIT